MPPSALNVTSAATARPSVTASTATNKLASNVLSDISSPHELTAFVDTLLERLDHRFDEMSAEILDRMAQMTARVDALEASLQDVINGDITIPTCVASAPASPIHVALDIQRSKSQNDGGRAAPL